MKLFIDNELKPFFSNPQTAFDDIMALQGEQFRHQDGRKTLRITLGGKYYFIKQHQGVGWREIIKNFLQLRFPIFGASNEWQALNKLQTLGVLSPKVLAYGQRGLNPAKLQSFVLMEELTSVISLEEIVKTWSHAPPSFIWKQKLIQEVARIARALHNHGMNHRDFYLCHFLLSTKNEKAAQLYLIDLHRAAVRCRTKGRWMIKDLGGLLFSCQGIGLTARDFYRFMKVYHQQSLRDILRNKLSFWQKVKHRGSHYQDRTK